MAMINHEKGKKSAKRPYKFTAKDHLILRELTKNTRATDSRIAKATGIPVKTVNRKRKKLEDAGLVTYGTFINNYETGTKRFNAQCMYTLHFNFGITKEQIKSIILEKSFIMHPAVIKHVLFDFVGEKEGRAVYSAILVSRASADMVEILNAEIVPLLTQKLGSNAIAKVEEMTVRFFNKTGHNNHISWLFTDGIKIIPEDSTIYICD
ncbi:MAG: winged helix-turn-helix transcriptional regulator [Nanoarchaeota archaeon]